MKSVIFVVVSLYCSFSISHAAVLNFSAFEAGLKGSPTFSLDGATIVADGTDIFTVPAFFGTFPGPYGGFCGIADTISADCATDVEITFSTPISNLWFLAAAVGPGDSVIATVFDGATPLFSIGVSGSSPDTSSFRVFDFGGISNITRLVLDDQNSTELGMFFGDFGFDEPVPIPLPASAILFGPVALAAGLRSRKRRNLRA